MTTKWETGYEAENREIREAVVEHEVKTWPHTWFASTHPDGSETGNPAPREWNPEQ